MDKNLVTQGREKVLRPFVHLHTHSEYSIEDGIAKIKEIVEKAMADGMPGIAITDHANMFGIAEFVECVNRKNAEQNTNFKPIIGCEVYVARRGMEHKSEREDFAGNHLVLLAKNYTGYKNLVKLVSRSWIDGFYGRARTDKSDLERYHEGLICCSACIGGEVAQHILNDRLAEAEESAMWYKNLFGEDYYFELHRHKATVERANHNTYKLESRVNAQLLALSQKLGIKVICANDAHFVNEEDAEVQDTLLCISWRKKYDDPARLVFSKQEWLKTTAEMNELFADIPEALDNTIEIFNKVERFSIEHAPILPKATLPEGVDEVEHLARLSFEGAHKRFGKPLPEEVKERLKEELRVINKRNYPTLFLLWHEIFAAAREVGAWIGPGRGKVASSLVAYCLGFTTINPLEWGLSYKELLNPKSSVLPRIEIEMDTYGQERIAQQLDKRFGEEHVRNIISYVCASPEYCLSKVKKHLYNDEEREFDAESLAIAKRLETVKVDCERHSCAIALCGDDISDWIPLSLAKTQHILQKVPVTQFDASQIESMGAARLDIMSNKFLDVIKRTVEIIRSDNGVELDIENIPKDDAKTYNLLRKGETCGVSFFEAKRVQEEVQKRKVNSFKDLVGVYKCFCKDKAHAICYTWLAYQTAYLKANYTHEYMEALLYCFRFHNWAFEKYRNECERLDRIGAFRSVKSLRIEPF